MKLKLLSVRLFNKLNPEQRLKYFTVHSLLLFCLMLLPVNSQNFPNRVPSFQRLFALAGIDSGKISSVTGTLLQLTDSSLVPIQKPPSPVLMLSPQSLQPNTQFDILSFRKELTEKHVINPTIFGTLKFSANSATVLLIGKGNVEVRSIVDIFISRRFARPHKDFFLFYVEDDVDMKQFMDLRYKYSVKTDSSGHTFVGHCGEKHIPFSHVCPGLIQGQNIRIASSNTPALFRPASNAGPAQGTLRSAFDEIDRRYNSSTFIRLSSFNGSAGMRLNNGTGVWRGTVGDVFDRDVNMSIATGITRERFRFIDFSVTHMWNERVFYIRTPPPRLSWLTTYRPLTHQTWVTTAGAMLLLIFPAMYIAALNEAGHIHRGAYFQPFLLFRALDTIWCVLLEQATFTKIWQGGRIRIIILLWTAVCLVVSTGYKAKLFNFLTFTDREEVPRTHLDLSLSTYKLYFRTYKGIVHLETRMSKNPMHMRFMARAIFPEHSHECFMAALTVDESACMDFILNGEYTIAVNTTLRRTGNIKIFIRSEDIDIRWMIMWIFAKGSPLTATYDRIKLQLLAGGHFDKWIQDDWAKKKSEGMHWLENEVESSTKAVVGPLLDELGHDGPKPLTWKNILSILVILAIGLTLGGLGWIFEKISAFEVSEITKRALLLRFNLLFFGFGFPRTFWDQMDMPQNDRIV